MSSTLTQLQYKHTSFKGKIFNLNVSNTNATQIVDPLLSSRKKYNQYTKRQIFLGKKEND